MLIFERLRTRFGVSVALAASALTFVVAGAGCDGEDRCIRFSDCGSGYTCADTHCVKTEESPGAAPLTTSDVDAADDALVALATDAAPSTASDAGARDGGSDGAGDAASDAPSSD